MKYTGIAFALFLIFFLSIGCTCQAPTKAPSRTVGVSPLASPLTFQSPKLPQSGPDFEITEPLLPGDTLVKGTGPSGVPIRILDVSLVGEEIGSGIIGDDGTFAIEVDPPLVAGHRIGIALGSLEGTDIDGSLFLRGDDYVDIPLVGILFDTAWVLRPTPTP